MRTPTLLRAALAALLLVGVAGDALAQATVMIRARDFRALYTFYRDDLGLPLLADDPSARRSVFDAGGTRVVLLDRRNDDRIQDGARLLVPSPDLGEARLRLESRGIAYTVVRDAVGTQRALFFADPEGHPLGFVDGAFLAESWMEPVTEEGRIYNDESGRVGFMVFGGIYGIWLGLAVPAAAGADEPAPYGIGIAAGGVFGVVAANALARSQDMSAGRAGVLSWIATFGTLQGVLWTVHAQEDDFYDEGRPEDIFLHGLLGGLGGLVVAIPVTRNLSISEGQSTIISSASLWGAWYGLVLAGMFSDEGGDFDALPPMLLGSAVGLAGGIGWAAGNDIALSRARLFNLGGLLGTAVGFGVLIATQPDDDTVAWGILGAGTFLGHLFVGVGARGDTDAPAEEASLLPYLDREGNPGLLLRTRF